jgi:hypothetical protein
VYEHRPPRSSAIRAIARQSLVRESSRISSSTFAAAGRTHVWVAIADHLDLGQLLSMSATPDAGRESPVFTRSQRDTPDFYAVVTRSRISSQPRAKTAPIRYARPSRRRYK